MDGIGDEFSNYSQYCMGRRFGDGASRNIEVDYGFGFVEMADDAQARAAIEALNGTDIGGRKAVVNEARPREERPMRG